MKPNDVPVAVLLTALRAACDWPVNTLDDSPPEYVELMRLGLAAVLTADRFAHSAHGVRAVAWPITEMAPVAAGADDTERNDS